MMNINKNFSKIIIIFICIYFTSYITSAEKFIYKLKIDPDKFVTEQIKNNNVVMDIDVFDYSEMPYEESKEYLYNSFLFGECNGDGCYWNSKSWIKYLNFEVFVEILEFQIKFNNPVIIMLRNITKVKKNSFHGISTSLLFRVFSAITKRKEEMGQNWRVYYN